MAAPLSPNLEARREQIFPILTAAEMQRLQRADPNTAWLGQCAIEVDAKGFVVATLHQYLGQPT